MRFLRRQFCEKTIIRFADVIATIFECSTVVMLCKLSHRFRPLAFYLRIKLSRLGEHRESE